MTHEEWSRIRQLGEDGLSIKGIARHLEISRNTVRKALSQHHPPEGRRARGSVVDRYEPEIRRLLAETPDITCTEIAKRISWTRSMTLLKDRVRVLRNPHVPGSSRRRVAPPGHGGDLPTELTSFVGRRQEIEDLRRQLGTARLVTVTGAGGIGKTRLALHVARLSRRAFTDGVHFIELADLTDPALVVQAIVDRLRIADIGGPSVDPLDLLIDYLRHRQTLLVIDNCEHLVEACSAVVHEVLRTVSQPRILATSRQALGVEGEHVFPLPPMSVGDNSALTLLAERGAAVLPGFELTADNRHAAQQLCRQLEGIPLAIELAAAQLRIYSFDELVKLFESRLSAPADNKCLTPDRHRSLRAALNWSFDLCTERERMLWARSSIFAGGFYLDALTAVCGADLLAEQELVQALAGLLDKSVITREEHAGRARFRMLETLREYGSEKLTEDVAKTIRRRHRDWYVRLLDDVTAEWFGPAQQRWCALLGCDRANIRSAIEFCLSDTAQARCGLHLVGRPWFMWAAAFSMTEHRHWLTRMLAHDTSSGEERAQALATCGLIAILQGDRGAASELLNECLRIAETHTDRFVLTIATHFQGLSEFFSGDMTSGERLLLKAYASYCEMGDRQDLIGTVEMHLGLLYVFQEDVDTALTYLTSLRSRSQGRGESWLSSYALLGIGLCRLTQGRVEEAKAEILESLRLKAHFEDMTGLAQSLETLAWVTSAEGRFERAAVLFGSAAKAWQSFGQQLYESENWIQRREMYCRQARAAIGDDAFNRAFAQGAAFEKQDILAYALETRHPQIRDKRTTPFAQLTRRESEVAELVAYGLSNKEIAARLVISLRTVEGHVENILRKLGFARRTQIAFLYGRTGEARERAIR